jgi:hypothetical protein
MLSRLLSPFELPFKSTIQYAVETKTARDATAFADFLLRSIPLFRLRADSHSIYHEPKPLEPFPLPPAIRTARDAVVWADASLRPSIPDRLAALAIHGTRVALSASHHCFDGVSFALCLNDFLRGHSRDSPILPPSVEELFAAQLSALRDYSQYEADRGRMSRLDWTCRPPKDWTDTAQADCLFADLAPESLQCYSAKTRKFVGLSEALWRSSMLVAHALSPGQSHFGCATWVNLRPYIPNDAIGNLIGQVLFVVNGLPESTTVGDLDRIIRRIFRDRIEEKYYLNGIKAMGSGKRVSRPGGAFFDVSNVGYFETTGPITDAFGQLTVPGLVWLEVIGLSSITIFGGDNDRLTLRYPYSQFVFTRTDAIRAFKAFIHSLQKIRTETKVMDAISELQGVTP